MGDQTEHRHDAAVEMFALTSGGDKRECGSVLLRVPMNMDKEESIRSLPGLSLGMMHTYPNKRKICPNESVLQTTLQITGICNGIPQASVKLALVNGGTMV